MSFIEQKVYNKYYCDRPNKPYTCTTLLCSKVTDLTKK